MKIKRIKGVLGIGLSAGLVFASLAAVFAAPAAAGEMEWTPTNTPSWEDFEILPDSDIIDYDIGEDDGSVVFAAMGSEAVLGSVTGGTSTWSTVQAHTGGLMANSALLAKTTGTGSTHVEFAPIDVVTFTAFDTAMNTTPGSPGFSFWYWQAAAGPGVQYELHFEDPDSDAWLEVTAVGLQGNTGSASWRHEQLGKGTLAGFGGVGETGTSFFDWGPLTDLDAILTDVTADVAVTDPGPWILTRIRLELWEASASTTYVDDVTANGICYPLEPMPMLVESDDGGITWTDITAKLQDASNLPAPFLNVTLVALAPDDSEWLAVAGYNGFGVPMVAASKDGGSNFSYAGDIVDTGIGTAMATIYDLDVSIEMSNIHNIALAGINQLVATPATKVGSVFRLKAGTWLTGTWIDTSDISVTTDYPGWLNATPNFCVAVVAVEFSPNFDLDDSVVCLSINDDPTPNLFDGTAFIQSGIWETNGSWNAPAGFGGAAAIDSDGDALLVDVYDRCCGLTLPADYDGSDSGARSVFVYVNGQNDTTGVTGGFVFRVDNGSVSLTCGPSGDPVLASIDVHGDADTGKLMIGEYIRWTNVTGTGPSNQGTADEADCCVGPRVWHTEELDFCCPQWDGACKDPSGPYMALVMYTPDGEKEYAATRGLLDFRYFLFPTTLRDGGICDESAFSVSLDDAVSFNQISLIDTDIDFLSDVAICPDCSVIYLSTINIDDGSGCFNKICACDSVWRSYDDGATWERVYHGAWSEDPDVNQLLLRLPCDAVEDCCDQDPVTPSGTLYLGIRGTDDIFYTRDCGQCWNDPPATKVVIQDFAAESENIVYVLAADGYISKSTQYGRRWSDAVDTTVKSGHSITSCCNEGFVVVAPDGTSPDKVGWSDDGGDTWNLTDALPTAGASGTVHVACDPDCENIIYAAVDGVGIYRTDVTDGAWDNMSALAINYTGIVVARTGGTLYASSYNIGMDMHPGTTDDWCLDRNPHVPLGLVSGDGVYSGVARNLGPCETDCCGTESWDYLICGLAADSYTAPEEYFNAQPSALRICGCLSAATNSILWAIDTEAYDVSDNLGDNDAFGSLWSYEDCAAKIGPDLTSPTDGSVLACELCAGCGAAPFTLKWERMCLACSYDIQIMDENGNIIAEEVDIDITGDPPSLYVDGTVLTCGETYTWKVREANTTCECVHSPWSEIWTFTIAVGASDAISLLSPDEGAFNVPLSNVGFSWTSVPAATTYSFVLSPNAALTGALVSQDLSSTAFNFVGPLDYDKAYYWQVKAWKDSTLLTTSSIGVFNTGSEPVTPPPPVVVEPTPAPILQIPPAQQITPTWIYAIIGIGAALAVVVIVLIVRTRRP